RGCGGTPALPEAGLEPALPKEGDFKSPASTVPPLGPGRRVSHGRPARQVTDGLLSHDARVRTLERMSERVHVSGIRLAHVDCAERTVQVNRPAIHEGPIQWEKPVRGPDGKVRLGRGKSGLSYRIKQAREWQVQ